MQKETNEILFHKVFSEVTEKRKYYPNVMHHEDVR